MSVFLRNLLVSSAVLFLFGVGNTALSQESAFYITPSGAVGVGVESPDADLEITDVDGNSFTGYRLNNQATAGVTWVFSNANNGSLQFNKIGSGGSEASFNSRLDADGKSTLVVQGSVDATQFNVASSRNLKTNFEELDSQDVLRRLAALPVTSWRYKHETKTTRHYGAMAEDFQVAFGLGDGKHISMADAVGVTMAAVQGLRESFDEVVKEKDAALAKLRGEKDAEIAALRARVTEVEAMQTEMVELKKLVHSLTSVPIAE